MSQNFNDRPKEPPLPIPGVNYVFTTGDPEPVKLEHADRRFLQARDWWVFSTAIRDVVLMVECQITGAFGIVRNPTKEEWSEAFHAPRSPYPFRGDAARVEIVREAPPVWRVKSVLQEM